MENAPRAESGQGAQGARLVRHRCRTSRCGLAGALMLYALIVPDSSGSPDAHGMSLGASLAIFLLFGLPTILVGGVILMLSEGDAPDDEAAHQ